MLAKLASSSSSAVVPNDKSAGQKCHNDCKHTLPCGHLICNECLDSIISPRYARGQGVAYTGICADKECRMAFKSTVVRNWNGERYECGSSIGEPKPSRPPLTFPTVAKPIPAKAPATPKQPKQVPADPETPNNLEDDDLPLGPDELLFSSRSYRAAEKERLSKEEPSIEADKPKEENAPSEPGSGHTTPRLQPSESLGLGILHISGGAVSSNSYPRPMSRARATSISGSPSKRARLRHRRVNPPASLDTIPPVVPLPGPSKSLKRARSSSSHASVEPESKPRKRRGYGIRPLERESSFDMPNSSQAKNEAYAGIWQRESAALHVPDRERGDSEDDGEYSIQSSSQRTIFRSSQSSV
ncbi:hypothetical protein BDV93DRAFT_607334 [Ceratobasidium sp. AG-I]|nr:hypothetical protein BDV93DRAFT_607334 [Ceratobasidium sp. AG-I]